MGREANCTATWQGETAHVKVLLESTEIILRGEIRGRIPRAEIVGVVVSEDHLVVDVSGELLTLALGRADVAKWAAALLKSPPTLAEKLGLSAEKRAFVLGDVDDEALTTALTGTTTIAMADADVIVAVLRSEIDLTAAFETARSLNRPIWMVSEKGKAARVSDGAIRSFLRAQNFIDTKTSAVSDRWTATRYRSR